MNNPIETMIDITMKNVFDSDEHLMTLFGLTLSMKPNNVFELGVRTCRTTFPFLYACNMLGSNLYSVDIDNIKPDFNFPEEWKRNWKVLKMDAIKFLTDDFSKIRSGGETGDLIFIDDWHTGPHVRRELAILENEVTPKDVLILHDLMYGNSQPHYRSVESAPNTQWDGGGPYRPVSELNLDKWEYMTIPRCHGLTLLRKKSDTIIRT